jgi:hypothetical protein
MQPLSTVSTGNQEINASPQNWICSKCGFSNKARSSAPVVVTWAAGLGLNIPAVPTADRKTKILLIYYTAAIVNKLAAWLQSSHTDPDLAQILPVYLLNRGSVALSSIECLPRDLLWFATLQDIIGWDNFRAWNGIGTLTPNPTLTSPCLVVNAQCRRLDGSIYWQIVAPYAWPVDIP